MSVSTQLVFNVRDSTRVSVLSFGASVKVTVGFKTSEELALVTEVLKEVEVTFAMKVWEKVLVPTGTLVKFAEMGPGTMNGIEIVDDEETVEVLGIGRIVRVN